MTFIVLGWTAFGIGAWLQLTALFCVALSLLLWLELSAWIAPLARELDLKALHETRVA